MVRSVRLLFGTLVVLVLGAQTATAWGADFAQTARNIIPSGQYGSLPPPTGADIQAKMYDGLTPLFDNVTGADFNKYFKSERFGIDTDGPGTVETVPHPGVSIVRDKFNVPHVNATNYDGGIWAAGWIAAEDRGLLLAQARYNARVAAIDAPGLSALGPDRRPAELPAQRPDRGRDRQADSGAPARRARGRGGAARHRHLHLGHQRLPGVAQSLDRAVDAERRLRAERTQGPVRRPGRRGRGTSLTVPRRPPAAPRAYRGKSVFDDLRQFKNPESPTTVDGTFDYGQIPERPAGSVILDPGSFQPTPAVAASDIRRAGER